VENQIPNHMSCASTGRVGGEEASLIYQKMASDRFV